MAQFQEDYGQYNQSYSQDFYQTNYAMPEGEGAPNPGVPAQQQQQPWGGGVSANQAYYPPPPGYDNQAYAQQQDYMEPSGGHQMGVEPPPGSMGQMDSTQGYGGGGGEYGGNFEDEPPLLEELGINFELIKQKVLSVLNPFQQTAPEILNDTDLAGPLIFGLLFGIILLVSGKVHFGYIYGVGLMGCIAMYIVLNLMSAARVSVGCVVSVLGYCLLPMVLLSSFSIVVHLQGVLGSVLSLVIIVWCSYSASKLFVSVLSMNEQQLLVAYPCALLYGVFALLVVF